MASFLCAQINPGLSLPEIPTFFHHPAPWQPSFFTPVRKNYSIRVTCTLPSATNLGAQESVASSSSLRDRWLPVSPIKNLDPNRPTLVYLLNRDFDVRVENVHNQWVALRHEGTDYDILGFGDCRSPQASSDGPRFPLRESNCVLFLWPDEDGWEEARATKLPSVKPTDIMTSMMNGSIVISEVPATDYKEDSMNEKSTDVPKPCSPCRGTSAKSSSDMKSIVKVALQFLGVALQFLGVALQFLFQNKEIKDLFAEFLKPHLIIIIMFIKKYLMNPNLVASITFAVMFMLFVALKEVSKKDNETTIK